MSDIKEVLGFQDIEGKAVVRILSFGRIIGESCAHAFYHSPNPDDFEEKVKEELSRYIGRKIPGSDEKLTEEHYKALCFFALNPSVEGLSF